MTWNKVRVCPTLEYTPQLWLCEQTVQQSLLQAAAECLASTVLANFSAYRYFPKLGSLHCTLQWEPHATNRDRGSRRSEPGIAGTSPIADRAHLNLITAYVCTVPYGMVTTPLRNQPTKLTNRSCRSTGPITLTQLRSIQPSETERSI